MNLRKDRQTLKLFLGVLGILILWLVYNLQAQKLYTEIQDFVTEGASYVVRVLEFTHFRGEALLWMLILYFVLVSMTNIFLFYIFKKSIYNKKRLLSYIILFDVVLVSITCVIANLFWPVYLLLTLLSILIIAAAVHVSSIIWGKTVTYNKGDVVFCSEGFETEDIAKNNLNKKIKEIDKNGISKLSGNIFEYDDMYYFEIYANDKTILDNKGEFIVNEKI